MSTSLESVISQLKGKPDENQLKEVLLVLKHNKPKKPSQRLELASVLVTYTVNELYPLLNLDVKNQLVASLTNLEAISVLVSNVRRFSHQTVLYLEVLLAIITRRGFLASILDEIGDLEFKETNAVFFGSKLFSLFNELFHKHKTNAVHDLLQSWSRAEFYTEEFGKELGQVVKSDYNKQRASKMLVSLLKVSGNDETFFRIFQSATYWENIADLVGNYLPGIDKITFIRRLIKFNVANGINSTDDALYTHAQLMESLMNDTTYQPILSYCLELENNAMLSTMALLLPEYGNENFEKALGSWGSPGFIQSSSVALQQSYTSFLLMALDHIDRTYVERLTADSVFLNSITNRINSSSPLVRQMGIALANKISILSPSAKPIFSVSEAGNNVPLSTLRREDYLSFFKNSPPDWSKLKLDRAVVVPNSDLVYSASKLSLNLEVDSDDEAQSEAPRPMYIKQLLDYLRTDSPQHVKTALKEGAMLIRAKGRLGSEVAMYAKDLITTTIGMDDRYEISNFNDLKLNVLISLVISDGTKDSIGFVIECFTGGDYSLQQRLLLLSSLGLGCREMRGHKDLPHTAVTPTFPTKTLPKHIHNQFENLEGKAQWDTITNSIEDKIIRKHSHGLGQVVNMSARLKSQQKQPILTEMKPAPGFYQFLGAKLFFPLVGVWQTSISLHGGLGFDVGRYSHVLNAHFIQTLGLILDCAYPSSVDLPDMLRETLALVKPLMHALQGNRNLFEGNDDILLLSALIFVLLVIVDNTSEQMLAEMFPRDILEISDWSQEMFGNISDPRLVKKCASLALKLHTLIDNNKATMTIAFVNPR